MLRTKSQLAAVAAIVMLGFSTRAEAANSCAALLTANDVAAVLGTPVKAQDTGVSYQCMYISESPGFQGEYPTVTLIVHGGRADFDQSVSLGKQYGMPYASLSGLGDKAYENNSCGEQCAEVGVMKGKVYFTVMVQEDLNHSKSAVALARKVSDRIK
jgi:hypothetical protein